MPLSNIIILSILQGVSELFPISSLGHTIIVESLFNIKETQNNTNFLPFIVALHLGTAVALIIYFKDEWLKIITSFINTLIKGKVDEKYEKLSWILVIGTIPVGIIGFFLEKPIKSLFTSPTIAGIFLICNGAILLGTEKIKNRRNNTKSADELRYNESFIIGLSQSLALLPGISRSGISMASSLLFNLTHEEAAYISFMLATPVILLAGVLEIPNLFTTSLTPLIDALIGAVLSGTTAFFSVKFLMRYFKTGNLNIYGYYSIIVGILSIIYFK